MIDYNEIFNIHKSEKINKEKPVFRSSHIELLKHLKS